MLNFVDIENWEACKLFEAATVGKSNYLLSELNRSASLAQTPQGGLALDGLGVREQLSAADGTMTQVMIEIVELDPPNES